MENVCIEFEYEKETPGTYRYKEISDKPIVGTLYIRKFAFDDRLGQRPDKIKVTIEEL